MRTITTHCITTSSAPETLLGLRVTIEPPMALGQEVVARAFSDLTPEDGAEDPVINFTEARVLGPDDNPCIYAEFQPPVDLTTGDARAKRWLITSVAGQALRSLGVGNARLVEGKDHRIPDLLISAFSPQADN